MTSAFYQSPEWKTLRLQALKRDRFACRLCGRSVAAKGQSRVDHIETLTARPDLALDLSNLRTLCAICDNKRHRDKGGQGQARTSEQGPAQVGADGYPIGSPWC